MAKTKGITGCTILTPFTPAAAMRTLNMLSEMDLLKEGVEPCVTPRLRKPGETGAIVLKGSVQAEGTG